MTAYYSPDKPDFQTQNPAKADELAVIRGDFHEKTLFVQERGRFVCKDGGLFDAISRERGHAVHCRDPRCSFECRRRWGERESWMLQWRLNQLPPGHQLFRGCLRLPKDANAEDHERAKRRFSEHVNAARKQYAAVIEFCGYAHDTSPCDRHWDFVAFTDRPDVIRQVIHDAAAGAGKATCVLFSREEAKARCNYATKASQRPGGAHGYVFLPAADGSRLVWSSRGFWEGRKTAAHAAFIAMGKAAPMKISNISTPPKEEVRRQLYSTLPETPDEAANIGKIAWHIRWPNGVGSYFALLKELLAEMPVREVQGAYYLLTFAPRAHADKVFGRGKPVCFHKDHWPLPLALPRSAPFPPGYDL
jgi:hypothetical protein